MNLFIASYVYGVFLLSLYVLYTKGIFPSVPLVVQEAILINHWYFKRTHVSLSLNVVYAAMDIIVIPFTGDIFSGLCRNFVYV